MISFKNKYGVIVVAEVAGQRWLLWKKVTAPKFWRRKSFLYPSNPDGKPLFSLERLGLVDRLMDGEPKEYCVQFVRQDGFLLTLLFLPAL